MNIRPKQKQIFTIELYFGLGVIWRLTKFRKLILSEENATKFAQLFGEQNNCEKCFLLLKLGPFLQKKNLSIRDILKLSGFGIVSALCWAAVFVKKSNLLVGCPNSISPPPPNRSLKQEYGERATKGFVANHGQTNNPHISYVNILYTHQILFCYLFFLDFC